MRGKGALPASQEIHYTGDSSTIRGVPIRIRGKTKNTHTHTHTLERSPEGQKWWCKLSRLTRSPPGRGGSGESGSGPACWCGWRFSLTGRDMSVETSNRGDQSLSMQVHGLASQTASQHIYHRLRWAVEGRVLTAPLLMAQGKCDCQTLYKVLDGVPVGSP